TLFTVVDEAMGLPSAQVMAIASRRDSLYIGTWEAGLFVFKDGKITPRPLPAPQVPAITSLLHTSDGRLWIGTRENGLFVLSRGIFKSFTAPHRGLASNAVYAIYETPALRLFVGLGNGAAEVRNDSFFTLPQLNERVVSLRQIGDDSLLLATEKAGLFLWHNSTMNRWLTHTLADSSLVNCMVTMGNDLWLGSSDNGILKWNKATGKLMVINKRDGLRSDFIYNITDDGRGNIWAGTGYGIHKITLHNDTPVVHFYGRDAGVTGTESNINAVLRQPDGGIWFGTTKGAIHYEPHAHAVEARPLAIVLQSVKIIGEASIDSTWYDSSDNWYGVPYQLRLPYRKNNVAFSFAAISLSGAGQLLYRYRLEGLDAPWSEWGPTTSVTFSALPPGKYVFVVQCTGAASLHTPELRYAFEIATPFHKTWWFYLGVLLACLLLGILLQAAYSRQRQRRNKLRMRLRAEEQSKIRLRTAEDFHDEVGNKLTRINVLTNILKSKTAGNEEAERLLNQIQDNTAQLYSGTRDILWSLKPTNDNLYEILFRINDFAGELFQDTSVQFTFTGIQEDWRKYRMPMDVNRNLTMIFKEALNNILKYADASEVSLVCSMKGRNVCVLTLSDDGRGFDTRQPREGNGLHNMMVRAGRINGRLYVDSRPGKGTILTLSFRIPRNLH
ncbi:MAG: hypothetical protein EBZ77_09750, partial [Chitinophagia bacterium]|nr:hypothetical protein [Chitinophagia bacterium]